MEFTFEGSNMLYVSRMIWDPGGFMFIYWGMEYYFSLRVILVIGNVTFNVVLGYLLVL